MEDDGARLDDRVDDPIRGQRSEVSTQIGAGRAEHKRDDYT